MVRFHETLSRETVRARYFGTDLALAERTAHERLTRICFIDYDREMALVAETAAESEPVIPGSIVGVARLSRTRGDDATLSLVVTDAWQGRGIGTALLECTLDVAAREGIAVVRATLSPANGGMHRLLEKAGFGFEEHGDEVHASRRVDAPVP